MDIGKARIAGLLLVLILFTQPLWAAPKNIIFFIGDGMGYEEVKAASLYKSGKEGTLVFEDFPHQDKVTTQAADGSVTDSAASSTAMATGHKVNNGVISMAIPGDEREYPTALEILRDRGKRTGLVTTTYMTHATPAGFGAHAKSRGDTDDIGTDYFTQTKPNVLLGGGGHGVSPEKAEGGGYTVVTTREEMQALDTDTVTHVSGQFGVDHLPYEYDYTSGTDKGYDSLPHLSEMVETAIAILEKDPDGFFLMVEGGRIDHAGHGNEIERNVYETIEFEKAVQVSLDWAEGRDDTLIMITADHETGGLEVVERKGPGEFPEVTWSTGGHTGTAVPVYAWGRNADLISDEMDNTRFFDLIVGEDAEEAREGNALQ